MPSAISRFREPVEIASMLLLAGLVGAYHIGRRFIVRRREHHLVDIGEGDPAGNGAGKGRGDGGAVPVLPMSRGRLPIG